MKEHFLLGPDITYLNHGSFGACPRPLFEQHQLEMPVFSNAHGYFFRTSSQAYNTEEDFQRLLDVLGQIL